MTMAETEYSRAKTSVWWDIENCEVPRACDAHAIAQNVSSALLNMNYCGPVSISAYGDTNLIPHAVQQALSSTGVGLNHVPAGVKDASDKKILVDMLLWAVDNPAPANFMLISGDRDFSNALHQLSMRRYTILLAQPPRASAPLVAAAKNVWLWTSLALGGSPLTNGESSRLVNNGRCPVSNYETSKDPVSEQAQSSKPTDSTSDGGDIKDHTIRENKVSRGNMLPNGRRAAGESVASCDSFEAHFSDKGHTSQAAFVASHKDQTNVSAKPIQETACQISCPSKDAYAKHTYGKIHRNNLELQSGKSANMSRGPVGFRNEVMEKQKNKKKATEYRTKSNADYTCRLCNVVCQSQVDFDSHLRGQKHASMALIGSKKLQEKSLGEKDQPREAIAEPQLQSLNAQEDTKCFEKHVSMVNQSEAHIDSTKLEEKGVQEKFQPIETMSEPRPQSQNTKENTKFFEKQNEEFREICGTLESSVQENFLNTKDQVGNVIKQLPNGDFFSGDFEIPREARECFDSTVKPVHQFDEATEHSGEVKREQKVVMVHRSSKLCHLCVVVCDIQGLSRVVCDSKFHWRKKKHATAAFVTSDDSQSCVSKKPIKEPEVLQHVWCQVCQISCNSKVAYANHTYGKKHRQNLELQSTKNENMSKGPAKLSEENAERMKKVLSKNQTAFGSQSHAVMAKEQTEKAFVDPRSTRQAFDQRALEHALIIDSRKIREENDIEKETTEEHTLIKIDDLGFQGGQEDKEEVKDISESLARVFTEPNQESRIPKESRGCLDVIPERVQLPAGVNVTEMEDESKHKPEPKSRDYTGLKDHPGEAAKREESKVQVDNFWTRLRGKKE